MESSPVCSSSTHQWNYNYDVYIALRGEDTRKTFVGHLYAALYKRGIITYLDTETLPTGESIFRAIQESRIILVVFSKHYAESQFCLEELTHILYCRDASGQIVVPIYYDVDPSDVRKQRGSFGEGFAIQESRNLSNVEIWRKALKDASDLSGWDIRRTADGYEAKVIQLIVEWISDQLFPSKHLTELMEIDIQDHKLRDSGYDSSKQINTSVKSSPLANHDVFLSFQGEDTGRNFVDHLHSALEEHGILTYNKEGIYFTNLSHSDTIKIIEESRISIIIFSINYASSEFCLDELAYIMKCRDERGHIVIPLFYHVEPSDVRHQRGKYEKAFSKHELMINPSKDELWRKTLKEASNLSGWSIWSLADGHEAKGIQLIIKTISNMLNPNKDLIGLQTRLVNIKYGGGGIITIPPTYHEDLRIPFHEISSATNNFSNANIIGKGGFGNVYRGESKKLGMVAVKKLDRRPAWGQGDNQYVMEIDLVSTYKHENIVSLVGYCSEDDQRILVYKYEVKGSLDNHIHKEDLTWIQRLRICLDAANGLKYLHEDVRDQKRIFHRDVKCANILLDDNWKAKISDFGLSKVIPANVLGSVITSHVCGTLGYVDPQYYDHDHLSQKSDVYSFGVVLFEVLCSKQVNARQYHFSAQLARNHYEKETLDEIIVPSLRSQMNSDCLSTYSAVAYQCLKKQNERPTMGQVVDQLEKALDYQQGSSGYWHDVYICYRLRDPKCHVVNDICDALHQGDVSTYKDEVTLSRNESVLLKAIKRSRLFVIIFTKKFAINFWYLDEVANIIECMKENRQIILPVFLNVSRDDVRMQKGYFGEVMSEYDRHPRMEVWRNALTEATNAPGLEYSKFRSGTDFVKKVVEDIKIGLSTEYLSTLQVSGQSA